MLSEAILHTLDSCRTNDSSAIPPNIHARLAQLCVHVLSTGSGETAAATLHSQQLIFLEYKGSFFPLISAIGDTSIHIL